MKKLVKVLIIVLIGIVLGGIIAFINLNNNNSSSKKDTSYKISNKLLDEIKTKKDMLIYVTNDDKNCPLCDNANNIINFYEKAYGLEFYVFDRSDTSDDDFYNLTNSLYLIDDYVTNPAVILIKNGKSVAVANEMFNENALRSFLIEYNYIDESKFIDDQIEDDEFNSLYPCDNKSLVLFYPTTKEGYNYREKLFELASKYNFSYNSIYYGFGNTLDSVQLVTTSINDGFDFPVLVIIQNNKVVAYEDSNNSDKLIKFLKDNNIIN